MRKHFQLNEWMNEWNESVGTQARQHYFFFYILTFRLLYPNDNVDIKFQNSKRANSKTVCSRFKSEEKTKVLQCKYTAKEREKQSTIRRRTH